MVVVSGKKVKVSEATTGGTGTTHILTLSETMTDPGSSLFSIVSVAIQTFV